MMWRNEGLESFDSKALALKTLSSGFSCSVETLYFRHDIPRVVLFDEDSFPIFEVGT